MYQSPCVQTEAKYIKPQNKVHIFNCASKFALAVDFPFLISSVQEQMSFWKMLSSKTSWQAPYRANKGEIQRTILCNM